MLTMTPSHWLMAVFVRDTVIDPVTLPVPVVVAELLRVAVDIADSVAVLDAVTVADSVGRCGHCCRH